MWSGEDAVKHISDFLNQQSGVARQCFDLLAFGLAWRVDSP